MNALPLLIGAGIGAWLLSRGKASAAVSHQTKSIEQLMLEAGQDEELQRTIQELSQGDAEIALHLGPMLVGLTLKVSGAEKLAISFGAMGGESGLRNKAKEFAVAMQRELPGACPGAPVLVGEPKLTMSEVDGGYRVQARWVAEWGHKRTGPVKERVRDCIARLLKADAQIGDRVRSVTATRLS